MIYVSIEQHQADKIRHNACLILFWLDRIKNCDKDEKEISHIMGLIREQAEAARSSMTEVMQPCLMTRDELVETVTTPCLRVKSTNSEATEESE